MKAKKILIPTDFSDHSQAALHHATALARDSGAKLLIIHVNVPQEKFSDTGFTGYPISDSDEAELTRMLADTKLADGNVACERKLLNGQPAAEIIRFADEEGVDMIVIGTHGRTGLTRMLMGSVAEAVVRGAKCPVLTIKQPHDTKVNA